METLSDLVRDWKLESVVEDDITLQIRHVSNAAAGLWRQRVEERWKRTRELGRGSFGVVWLEECTSGPSNGQLRAVKELRKTRRSMPPAYYSKELEAIAKFSHERYHDCFVRSFGWFDDDLSIFIAMEYLPLGDLEHYLEAPLPESQACIISRQILQGLVFMHENKFAHRDMKPANILVFHEGPNWWVKISDFGISKRVEGTSLRTMIGTESYLAPEVRGFFCDDGVEDEPFSLAVDIWAVGAIVFRMITGQLAFRSPRDLSRYVASKEPFPVDSSMSPDCTQFVQAAMDASPRRRPTAEQALGTSWVEVRPIEPPGASPLPELGASPPPVDLLDQENPTATSSIGPVEAGFQSPDAGSSASPPIDWSKQKPPSSLVSPGPPLPVVQASRDGAARPSSLPKQGEQTLPYYPASARWSDTRPNFDVGLSNGVNLDTHIGSGHAVHPDAAPHLETAFASDTAVAQDEGFSPDLAVASETTVTDQSTTAPAVPSSSEGIQPEPLGESPALASRMTIGDASTAVSTLRGMPYILSVAFSPNSKFFAVGSKDSFRLYKVEGNGQLRLTQTLGEKLGFGQLVVFSRDGRLLASSSPKTIYIWQADKQGQFTVSQKLDTRVVAVSSIVFSPDGRYLASASSAGEVKLWQAGKDGKFRAAQPVDDRCSYRSAIAFSPDGQWFAFGADQGGIRLWQRDYASNFHFRRRLQFNDRPLSLVFSPNSQLLASGSLNEIVLWRFDEHENLQLVQRLVGIHEGWIDSLVFSPGGGRLASACSRKSIIWERSEDGEFRQIWEFQSPNRDIPNLAFSPNGKWYALGTGDIVFIWEGDSRDRPLAQRIAGHVRRLVKQQ